MKDWRSIGLLMQLSWLFAFTVLLPLLLGIWLDRVLLSSPLFLLVGGIFGILAGTLGAVRLATRTIEDIERAHQKTEETPAEGTPDAGVTDGGAPSGGAPDSEAANKEDKAP